MATVENLPPTQALVLGNPPHRSLAAGAARRGRRRFRGFLLGRSLRRRGRGLVAAQERAAASAVGFPLPTAEAAEATRLDEALGQNVQRPATRELPSGWRD